MTLRVTFEIVPFGIEEDKHTIGTLNISRIESREYDINTYYGILVDANGTTKETELTHRYKDPFYVLVFKTLRNLIERS